MKLFVSCVAFCMIQLVSSEDSPLVQQFATGSVQFTADVYRQLKEINDGDNFLFCPLSALIILGLTQTAARGITAQQLSNGLHLPEDRKTVEQTFQQLLPTLKGNDKYTLTSANKIYVKNGYKINEEYKNIAQNSFGAEIQNINFEEKNAAAAEMNDWVASKTHDKIRDLIDPSTLSKDSRLMLINALYFKGSWRYTFNERNTLKRKFFTKSDNHIEVDMMEATRYFKYHSSSTLDAQFLEIPYQGDDVSMVVVLPNQVEGLSTLENSIEAVLNTKLDWNVEVHLQLPKFKRETKVKLTKILQKLGITDAFEDWADFSGFGEPGQQPIKISDVVQKSVIEVDEKGTVAAAATAVHAVKTYSLIQKPPPKQFIADHPFIYFIKSPAGVMFIGRYVK
ncbi:antichymotrypsin-2-like [Photinus pyralis]|uniref:antichymotrypsin-2-like n=1 Tax=Photinus pyralis TaxID=7054 RepID=UPI001266EA75|nr:antichymotrypsin-2-like [Photinus pyralis]